MKKVSIVIPAYNEGAFIKKLLETLLDIDLKSIGFEREIILIDNGSFDRTYEIASSFNEVKCFRIEKNKGKGDATRYGIAKSTGDYILIQDADLEYDPKDYVPMLEVIKQKNGLFSVYGSRILGEMRKNGRSFFPGKNKDKSLATYAANTILSLLAFVLYGKYITDTLTGYKIYPAEVVKKFNIETFGFETDHELTAKLIRSGVDIIEVPISYNPRTVEEGKKIRMKDFFIACQTFLKYRFVSIKKF